MKIIKKGYTYKHEVVTETFYEEERGQKKRYGRNRYKNMSEEDKDKI